MKRSRILALDPGSKRIGVALSDELGWFAQPLETYERRSLKSDLTHIQDLVERHEVAEVVMGSPVLLDGKPGTQADAARLFMERLAQELPVPVVAWDERLTTKAAERLLIEADVSRRKRKYAVDRVAAAMLLQSYLDSRSASGRDRTESQPLGNVRKPDEPVEENSAPERV